MSRLKVEERVEVPFSVVPLGRTWVAAGLGLAGISLALGLALTLAERARAHRGGLVAEALSAAATR